MHDDQTNQKLFSSRKQIVKCIYFNPIQVATKQELISILTLIVQTTVSAVLGTFSKQQQGALKVSFWSIFC